MDKLTSRNILLAILLLVLLIVVLLFRSRTPFGKDQTSFASMPKNEITKIEFSAKGEQLILEKKGNVWMVNGRHEARRSGIAFIERILSEIRIKSPVTPELFDEEIFKKNIDPVKVRVYENNKLLNSFLVYRTGSNIYGNIMKMREKSKPFIVYLPGYEGDIGSGFTMNELFWQPYSVFNLLPSEISTVTFEDFSDPSSSFKITRNNNVYTLSDNDVILTGWDSSRVMRYISYFTLIPFESWALDLSADESEKIGSESPVYRITVVKDDGTERSLTLWKKTDITTGETDSDRLWGKTGESGNLFVMRYFDIDPLLKKKSYFFTE